MKFSFAITTTYDNLPQIEEVKDSIRKLNIPEYEIVLIGGQKYEDENDTRYVFFDETQKQGWVTRKKNTAVECCKYDNVVLMHDYYVFDTNWYKHMCEFGDNWEVCSCQQLLINGKRHFTDWVVWDSPFFPRYTCLPYDEWTHTPYMYQSGGFMMVKKHVIKQEPFNENLTHGQAEDVEWSLRMRNKFLWKCNGGAIVKHNKVHRDAK